MPKTLKMTMPKETEAGKRKRWVAWLRWARYVVMQIGQFRWAIRCPHCHAEAKRDIVLCTTCKQAFPVKMGYGNDPGAPDDFVTHPDWELLTKTHRIRIWIALELKAEEKSPVRDAQKELIDAGHVEKIWTDELLAEAVNTVNDALNLPRLKPL